jgi:RNA polymerase sigma factor (sigma-70 family)
VTVLLTDRQAWQRARAGDHECFGLLYDRHAGAVYGYLLRRTGSWTEAEDLTSAVFLLAWAKRARVVLDRDSLLPWLLGVAHHALLNQRRTTARYRHAMAKIMPEGVPDHSDDVADRLDDQRCAIELRSQVRRLPRHERDVIELCVWAELDQKAAAVALGVAVGTVKSRLSRARRRLASMADLNGSAELARAANRQELS